jgi:hypothetical protein
VNTRRLFTAYKKAPASSGTGDGEPNRNRDKLRYMKSIRLSPTAVK